MQKPDWNIWRTKEKVKVWQAPLLSLDREPNGVSGDNIDWRWLQFDGKWPPDNELPTEFDGGFKQRMESLLLELQRGHCFVVEIHPTGWGRVLPDEISLGTFAAWCELSNLDIPTPLAEISNTYGGVERLQAEATTRQIADECYWYDATLEAATFYSLKSVTPREAAMLHCRFNPHKANDDHALTTTTDEPKPDDYKRLLRVFEDEHNADPKARTLRQWHDIAHTKQLPHHSWICRYSEAMRTHEANANSNGSDAAPAESKPEGDTTQADIATDSGEAAGPRTAIGKCAIEAAAQIKQIKLRAASVKDVMELLKQWAEAGTKPDILIGYDTEKRAVIWRTIKGIEKTFDKEACGKCLERWATPQ